MMDPSIPKNEGFFDAIDLIVPKGCCLNPPEGKSVAAGTHHPGTEVGEAITKALERVVPERSCPQIYKMGMPTVIFGTNPRDGKVFIDHSVDSFAAYCGAVRGQDGWGAMNVSFGNLIRATAEINEPIFPVRQLARDYETDSGGGGGGPRKRRGPPPEEGPGPGGGVNQRPRGKKNPAGDPGGRAGAA